MISNDMGYKYRIAFLEEFIPEIQSGLIPADVWNQTGPYGEYEQYERCFSVYEAVKSLLARIPYSGPFKVTVYDSKFVVAEYIETSRLTRGSRFVHVRTKGSRYATKLYQIPTEMVFKALGKDREHSAQPPLSASVRFFNTIMPEE